MVVRDFPCRKLIASLTLGQELRCATFPPVKATFDGGKMKIIIIMLIFICTLFPVFSSAQEKNQQTPIQISDKYYWVGTEGNLGVAIVGKFYNFDLLASTLDLRKEIGEFGTNKSKRMWILGDILVSVDFDANGYFAEWNVSGPKPLIQKYLKILEKSYKNKSLFYDFKYYTLNYKPTAYWER